MHINAKPTAIIEMSIGKALLIPSWANVRSQYLRLKAALKPFSLTIIVLAFEMLSVAFFL